MIYTPLINKAIRVAYEAHHGQTDKAGLPYIHHPLHLAEQMDDEASTCVAILHDVLEDSDVSEGDLRAEGFTAEIIKAVVALTHKSDMTYREYIQQVAGNPAARKVKLADLAHTLDASRLCEAGPIPDSLLERYSFAQAYLLSRQPNMQQEPNS